MKEGLSLAGLEEMVRPQIVHVNESLTAITGQRIPPIDGSKVKFITEAQAVEIAGATGQYISWAFAYKDSIYYVKEKIREKERSIAKLPEPFGNMFLRSVFALAHEGLHLGVNKFTGGPVSRDIAFTCWDALYEETVELTEDSEVPPGVKDQFRKVNQLLKDREAARVVVRGATLTMGTRNSVLYEFGRQQDEDLVDYMATMVFEDVMIRRTGALPDEMRARKTWFLNGDNRRTLEPDFIINLWNQLKGITGGNSRERFMDAYFGGRFYEEFAGGLDEEERLKFSCYVVLEETGKALEVVARKTGEAD